MRAGTEGYDLEVLYADDRAGYRDELSDHIGAFFCGADGIIGYVGVEMAHAEVIGAVEHAAVSVAAAVDHIAVALGSGNIHNRSVEMLADKGLGGLGTEVSEKYDQRVAAVGGNVGDSLKGVGFVFNGGLAVVNAFAVCLYDGFAAGGRESDREAVSRDGNNAELHFRNIYHL